MSDSHELVVEPLGAVAAVARRTPARAALAPRSGLRRIAAISASLAGTQAVTSVLGLGFWTLAARQSNIHEYGVAGAAVAFMMLVGTFGTLGFGTLLISQYPMTPQGQRRVLVRTSLLIAGAATAAIALVAGVAAVHLFDARNLRPLVGRPIDLLSITAGTSLMAVGLVLDQAVLVLGNGSLQLQRNVVASVVKIVALLAFGRLGATGGMFVFLAWTVGNAASMPWIAWRTRGGVALQDHQRRFDLSALRSLRRNAASHHSLNLALQAPLQILPLIVTVTLSTRENGYFTAAMLLSGFVFALPFAMSIGVFATAEGDEQAVLRNMRFTIPVGLAVSASAYVVLFPVAGFALHFLVHGDAPIRAVHALRVLVLAGLPFVVKDHFVALRRVQGKTTQASALFVVSAVVEMLAAAIGAHAGGIEGVCVGWVGVLYVEALLLAHPMLTAYRRLSTEPLHVVGGAPLVGRACSPVSRARELLGPVLVVMALGLLVIAVAVSNARQGSGGQRDDLLYLAGLVLLLLPPTVRVVQSATTSFERIALAVAVPVMLQLSRTLLSPTQFVFHDELIHGNVLREILRTGRLFGDNPLLPVSSFYPGLETATAAVRQVTGLSPFVSGTIVLLLARVVLALSIIAFVRGLTRSTRVACAAVIVYFVNPQQLFFNSQFSYQTLALPLAALTLHLFRTRRSNRASALVLPALAMAAVAITHHLTALLLLAALAVWLLLEHVLRPREQRTDERGLALLIGFGVVCVTALALNPGNPVLGYLGDIVRSSGDQLGALATGEKTKPLFVDSAGVTSAPWERLLMVAAMGITMLALLPALWQARAWWRRRVPFAVLLALVAVLFPLVPGGHVTRATAEVGDRSAGFVFVGVAFVLSWPLARRRVRLAGAVVLACLTSVVFIGNVIFGAGPVSEQLPGPYLIAADARSADADSLAASAWMRDNIPQGSRVYADRVGGLLAARVGGLSTVRHVSTGIDASRLLLDPQLTKDDFQVIRAARIAYLVADRRDAFGLPHKDVYIESGEFGEKGRTTPVPEAALRKFDSVAGVSKIFDNGSIVIYDLRKLR